MVIHYRIYCLLAEIYTSLTGRDKSAPAGSGGWGGTYCSEEGFHVLRLRVHDDVANVPLLDLTQHLAVSVHGPLPDVHFHFAGWRGADEILQPQQS